MKLSFCPRLEELEDRCLLSAIVKQFPIPGASYLEYFLNGITTGPDGNVWFTESSIYLSGPHSAGTVDFITPQGSVTKFGLQTASNPIGITTGPDGNLWVADPGTNDVERVTPSGSPFAFAIPTANSGVTGIAAGADGNLWFTETTANIIGRITPSGTITEFSIGLTVNSQPLWIAGGPDGNIWFTEQQTSQIGRITPAGVITEFATLTPGSSPGYITAGPDGNVWFTETQADRIGRITPAGIVSEFPLPRINTGLQGITLGPDGNLWFAESNNNKIGRITPAGAIAEVAVPAIYPTSSDITTGPDGNIWYLGLGGMAQLLMRPELVTGADQGASPDVRVFGGLTGIQMLDIMPYSPSFTGGVRVATGDVDGDGDADIITASGPGMQPEVDIFDGTSGQLVRKFLAYDYTFTGGVFVAVADLNGDGRDEIITAPDAGMGPDVRIYDGSTGLLDSEFNAYNAGFTGGVRIAVADVNGDGTPDIITGAGPGGGPDVEVFDGTQPSHVLQGFYAYNANFTGGVYVAGGDINGDGKADIITGAGAGGGPHVEAFSGANGAVLQSFYAYNPAFAGGVRVGLAPVNVDGVPEIVTSPGPSGGPDVRVFNAATLALQGEFYAYAGQFTGGVFAAGLNNLASGQPPLNATIKPFVTPTVVSVPEGIVQGPDKNLWFTEAAANKIGRITPSGTVTEFAVPTGGAAPTGIAAGSDGALWFTEQGAHRIGRITVAGAVTDFADPAPDGPFAITNGPDGNLWFTNNDDMIGRITTTGTVTLFPVANGSAVGITAGPDGNLWATANGVPGANVATFIARITPAGVVTQFALPNGTKTTVAITTGPDGNIWFSGGRITPAGSITTVPSGGVGNGVTAGPDGNLWYNTGASIVRTSPGGATTRFPLPPGLSPSYGDSVYVGCDPYPLISGITVGPDGNLWFTNIADTVCELVLPTKVPVPVPLIVTGTDFGGPPDVRVYTASGTLVREFMAYNPSFTGGVRVAVADVNGDGVPDIITAPGPGGGPDVRVFDGLTGAKIRDFYAYDPSFLGGVFVAAADFDGGTKSEIVTGADAGGTPEVRVFDGATLTLLSVFQAYNSSFAGGVRVAVEQNGEIVTAPGPGGGPDVRVFQIPNVSLTTDFNAYESTFTGGVYVAVGALNTDGSVDIITSPGPGRAPDVRIFNSSTGSQISDIVAYNPGFTGGVRVAVLSDVNNDFLPDLVTSPGPGGGPDVRVFDGATLAQLDEFYAYNANFTNGVYVGGQ